MWLKFSSVTAYWITTLGLHLSSLVCSIPACRTEAPCRSTAKPCLANSIQNSKHINCNMQSLGQAVDLHDPACRAQGKHLCMLLITRSFTRRMHIPRNMPTCSHAGTHVVPVQVVPTHVLKTLLQQLSSVGTCTQSVWHFLLLPLHDCR